MVQRKCEKEEIENRNKCADISLEISAIRCEISAEIWEKMWRKMEAAEINKMWETRK